MKDPDDSERRKVLRKTGKAIAAASGATILTGCSSDGPGSNSGGGSTETDGILTDTDVSDSTTPGSQITDTESKTTTGSGDLKELRNPAESVLDWFENWDLYDGQPVTTSNSLYTSEHLDHMEQTRFPIRQGLSPDFWVSPTGQDSDDVERFEREWTGLNKSLWDVDPSTMQSNLQDWSGNSGENYGNWFLYGEDNPETDATHIALCGEPTDEGKTYMMALPVYTNIEDGKEKEYIERTIDLINGERDSVLVHDAVDAAYQHWIEAKDEIDNYTKVSIIPFFTNYEAEDEHLGTLEVWNEDQQLIDETYVFRDGEGVSVYEE